MPGGWASSAVAGARLRPLHYWLAKHEQMWNERLDRIDDYLEELQKGERSDR